MVRWYRLWIVSDHVPQTGHVERAAVASSVATIWSGPIDTSSSWRPCSVGRRLVARVRVLGITPNRTGYPQRLLAHPSHKPYRTAAPRIATSTSHGARTHTFGDGGMGHGNGDGGSGVG